MSISRIEHRSEPVVLDDADLLASQRTLFGISPVPRFPQGAINQLGEVMAYEVALLVDEKHRESGRSFAEVSSTQGHIALMADKLMEFDPQLDPYEGFDRALVRIERDTQASLSVATGYEDFGEPYGEEGRRRRFFTPEGYVNDPIGDFRQTLVVVSMVHKSLFTEDAHFDFSSYGRLSLYTNNLSAQPPRWEYSIGRNMVSDMQPGRSGNPYFFKARPDLIASEELAQAVVGSLARVVDASQEVLLK